MYMFMLEVGDVVIIQATLLSSSDDGMDEDIDIIVHINHDEVVDEQI